MLHPRLWLEWLLSVAAELVLCFSFTVKLPLTTNSSSYQGAPGGGACSGSLIVETWLYPRSHFTHELRKVCVPASFIQFKRRVHFQDYRTATIGLKPDHLHTLNLCVEVILILFLIQNLTHVQQ